MNVPSTQELHQQLLQALRDLQSEFGNAMTELQLYHQQLQTDEDASVESPLAMMDRMAQLDQRVRMLHDAWRARAQSRRLRNLEGAGLG